MLRLINKYYKLCIANSNIIEAYHVGRKLDGGKFDFSYLGTGEGMNALGPGIYFVNDINLAKLYAKYSKRPYLYKALIPFNKLYNPVTGEPKELLKAKKLVEKQIHGEGKDHLDLFSKQKNRIEDSPHNENVRNLLKANGIGGFYITLPGGALEICIFDLSIITIIELKPLGSQEEYDEQERQELIEDSKCFWCEEQMWDPSTALNNKEDRIRRAKLEELHKSTCK
jgi:hypothetical protein